jgi:hypothetical protein
MNLGVLARLYAYKQSMREVSRVCIVLGFSQNLPGSYLSRRRGTVMAPPRR